MVTINNKTYSQGWQSHGNTSCCWAVHGMWWGKIWGTVFYRPEMFWLFRLSSVRWGILIYLLSWQYEVFNWLSLKCDESFASLNNEQWKQGDLWGTLESAHTPQGLSKVILDVNIPEIFTFTFFNFSFPTNFSEMSGKHSSPTWSAPAIALTTIYGSE